MPSRNFQKSLILWAVLFVFTVNGALLPLASAQTIAVTGKDISLPAPGVMVHASPAFDPVLIKGLRLHPDDPLLFDFMVDSGSSRGIVDTPLFKTESRKMIRYFLTALTLKENDVWVNLSPYEGENIMSQALSPTDMGREMLKVDYLLKQLTASLMNPQEKTGAEFWKKVGKNTRQSVLGGYHKVWIAADEARLVQRGDAVWISQARLKVMMQDDYLAAFKHGDTAVDSHAPQDKRPAVVKDAVRTVILPAIEKEVNEGRQFAGLRQIFYATILAVYYKQSLQNTLLNQVYSDKAKIAGMLSNDPGAKERIYAQYLKAYRKGVFNFILEEPDARMKMVPRKYFSGGIPNALGVPMVLRIEEGVLPSLSADQAIVTARMDKAQTSTSNIQDILKSPLAASQDAKAQEHIGALIRYLINDPDAQNIKEALSFFDVNVPLLRTLLDAVNAAGTQGLVPERLQMLEHFAQAHFSDMDAHLFKEGTHVEVYKKLGAQVFVDDGGSQGVYFAVWAPNAKEVMVMGDFNGWQKDTTRLRRDYNAGIWWGYIPQAKAGQYYLYRVIGADGNERIKSDPYAVASEFADGDNPGRLASRIWDTNYQWSDKNWLNTRARRQAPDSPMSIYEMHLGSWRMIEENGRKRWMNYRELAVELAKYLKENGFTHVEMMPPTEHHYLPSWGYLVNQYFAPSARYGSPQDLMYFVDYLHQQGIGVFMDWVPGHFPKDQHGLMDFDGSELYSHQDPKQGEHPHWGTRTFNYGRGEVKSFLLANALFWAKVYHIDGVRVDAVSSMLYLDYGREHGQWIPNERGGHENLQAISFIQDFNHRLQVEGVVTIAEESTSWGGVTDPNGLGFNYKWAMGWMNDTLKYMAEDPLYRVHHRGKLSFFLHYASSEKYLLALSHDEVVHLKGSLLRKMPGDDWQKLANLKVLMGLLYTMPGKKLLFMGGEFGQEEEWNENIALSWGVLNKPGHTGVARWTKALNEIYRDNPALHVYDTDPQRFSWDTVDNDKDPVFSFYRYGDDHKSPALVVINASPNPLQDYRLGVPFEGEWEVVLNSDDPAFEGSGYPVAASTYTQKGATRGRPFTISMNIPPLGVMVIVPKGQAATKRDAGMTAKELTMDAPGGVDLTLKNNELKVSSGNASAAKQLDEAMVLEFKQGRFDGINPVIVRVMPGNDGKGEVY